MRIHFENLTRPKLVAKSLRKALKGQLGTELSLSRCQEAVAAMYGYDDWHELTKQHAAQPPSADDRDCPDDVVRDRSRQYARVLSQIGVPPDHVPYVLHAVKPTDRSSSDWVWGSLPRFTIKSFETDEDGKVIRSLGMQDLTNSVVYGMVPYPGRRVREIDPVPTVNFLANSLSDEARRVGYEGRLSLPGFNEGVEDFIARVGGRHALPVYKQRLEDVTKAYSDLMEAERELARVRKARFTDDYAGQSMFHVSHDSQDYVESIDMAYDDWGWDEYVGKHPRPGWDDEAGARAWHDAYAAWRETKAPPYVFGTRGVRWAGISAEDIRESFEAGETFGLEDLIHSSLEDHYEDAHDHVVAMAEIYEICGEWEKHAGTGSPEDLALESRVAAWNARQTIETFFWDSGTILPTRPGLVHADAIAWCERDVSEKRRRLDDLCKWQAPEVPAEPEATAP